MLSVDEVHRAVRREWGRVLAALEPLDDAALAAPTRCTGWTVLDLARHTAWGTSMEADALRRARTGAGGVAQGRDADVGAAAVRAALREAVDALLHELDRGAVAPDVPLALPTGAVPALFGLHVFVLEAGVHADDLAAALGRDEPMAPDVVDATAVVLSAALPALAALAGEGAEAPRSGTVVSVDGPNVALRCAFVDGAWSAVDGSVEPTARVAGDDDTSVLRFALGRIPASDTRVHVSAEAADFKRWFPGP